MPTRWREAFDSSIAASTSSKNLKKNAEN
jgi:hypothetical protein